MQAQELESTGGRRARVEALRGRAVVVFYESRGHTDVNEPLKQLCGRLTTEAGDRLEVLGVANLRGLSFGAVRRLVTAAVKAVAARYGAELWMDFEGALLQAPYRLRDDAANVLVLAPDGRELFRAHGPVTGERRARFVEALRQVLTEAGAEAPSLAA